MGGLTPRLQASKAYRTASGSGAMTVRTLRLCCTNWRKYLNSPLTSRRQVIENRSVYVDLLLTRGFGPSARKGDLQNAILPLFRILGRPNEHKFVDDAGAGTSGI